MSVAGGVGARIAGTGIPLTRLSDEERPRSRLPRHLN